MLLMYRRKKVVDKVLPCGILCVMICVLDCACCVCVDCGLFWKYDLKNVVVFWLKLNSCCSLWINLACEIVSYALDRSMYIASVGLRLFLCVWMRLRIVCRARVVLEFGLNAN